MTDDYRLNRVIGLLEKVVDLPEVEDMPQPVREDLDRLVTLVEKTCKRLLNPSDLDRYLLYLHSVGIHQSTTKADKPDLLEADECCVVPCRKGHYGGSAEGNVRVLLGHGNGVGGLVSWMEFDKDGTYIINGAEG